MEERLLGEGVFWGVRKDEWWVVCWIELMCVNSLVVMF